MSDYEEKNCKLNATNQDIKQTQTLLDEIEMFLKEFYDNGGLLKQNQIIEDLEEEEIYEKQKKEECQIF